MRSDVHAAALRAAAKLAFSVAFLGGCSAETIDSESTEQGEDAIRSARGETNPSADAPAPSKKACGDKPSCEATLTAAFADPAWAEYVPWMGQKLPTEVSDEAKACCKAELSHPRPWDARFRWQCCGVLQNGDDVGDIPAIGMACTPWGPPVPPRMRSRAAIREAVS